MIENTTIAAQATGEGGAIAVIRVSGEQAIDIVDNIFSGNKKLSEQNGFTLHYGNIVNDDKVVDDVIVSLFRAPKSYTGENMVEISCHASSYIKGEIMRLLLDSGASTASPGEFTQRAFLNGKLDLSQAEAVSDIIASSTRSSHRMAQQQMRGGYSEMFSLLRSKLVELTSLLELELDFSEEDVEFADRSRLSELIALIISKINSLTDSFTTGNALKNGIPVAITGRPNVGKSTILNSLVGENRAMTSDIAGTTRDTIEESIVVDGIGFRFIDTAGLHHTNDTLESMGIERTLASVAKASIVLFVSEPKQTDIIAQIKELDLSVEQHLICVINKSDLIDSNKDNFGLIEAELSKQGVPYVVLSSLKGEGIDALRSSLVNYAKPELENDSNILVSNARHYEALSHAKGSLELAHSGLKDGLSGDLLSQLLREALHQIGTITGEITTDEILATIFSKFCIGK